MTAQPERPDVRLVRLIAEHAGGFFVVEHVDDGGQPPIGLTLLIRFEHGGEPFAAVVIEHRDRWCVVQPA
jgi:hypothetical protein